VEHLVGEAAAFAVRDPVEHRDEPDEDEGNREREGGGHAGGQPPGEIRVGDGEDRRQRQHERVEKPLHPQACVGATASVAQLTQVNTRDAAGVTMPESAR
jgi:hypothetical protein